MIDSASAERDRNMTIPKLRYLPFLVAALTLACADGSEGNNDVREVSANPVDMDPNGEMSGGPDGTSTDVTTDTGDTSPDQTGPDASPDQPGGNGLEWVPKCGVEPCPIVIESFPYTDSRATGDGVAASSFDGYSCAPTIREGGSEYVYVFHVDEPGTIVAGIDDGSGVDIDIHLLTGFDDGTCISRGHIGLSAHIDAGTYYLVADSWVNASGEAQEGAYTLRASFFADTSACAMSGTPIQRVGEANPLPMPTTGEVAKEAHLVTDQEFTGGTWPTGFTDGIDAHYALTGPESGYTNQLAEPWAPCCEGGNEYGQGSRSKPPVDAEAWYVNMRWQNAPSQGTRYIIVNPVTGQAIVGAAGYENGPGNLDAIGGAAEEIHIHFGTSHLGWMTFGEALDQSLPYGPINCE